MSGHGVGPTGLASLCGAVMAELRNTATWTLVVLISFCVIAGDCQQDGEWVDCRSPESQFCLSSGSRSLQRASL